MYHLLLPRGLVIFGIKHPKRHNNMLQRRTQHVKPPPGTWPEYSDFFFQYSYCRHPDRLVTSRSTNLFGGDMSKWPAVTRPVIGFLQ